MDTSDTERRQRVGNLLETHAREANRGVTIDRGTRLTVRVLPRDLNLERGEFPCQEQGRGDTTARWGRLVVDDLVRHAYSLPVVLVQFGQQSRRPIFGQGRESVGRLFAQLEN